MEDTPCSFNWVVPPPYYQRQRIPSRIDLALLHKLPFFCKNLSYRTTVIPMLIEYPCSPSRIGVLFFLLGAVRAALPFPPSSRRCLFPCRPPPRHPRPRRFMYIALFSPSEELYFPSLPLPRNSLRGDDSFSLGAPDWSALFPPPYDQKPFEFAPAYVFFKFLSSVTNRYRR